MSLAAYDTGLLNYLKEALSFDNIINSAETKAFDNIADHTEGVKVNVPLISFWRISNPVATESDNFPRRHRGKLMSTDLVSSTGVRWRTLPVTITYQITIWSDRRTEVDDIYRELMMYLITDNPHIVVKLEGMDTPEEFYIKVVDTDSTTDVDSFSDRGKLYTQNILVEVPDAQLLFSREVPIAKNIQIRTVVVDDLDSINNSEGGS